MIRDKKFYFLCLVYSAIFLVAAGVSKAALQPGDIRMITGTEFGNYTTATNLRLTTLEESGGGGGGEGITTITTTTPTTFSAGALLSSDGSVVRAGRAGIDYLLPAGNGSQLTGITANQVGLGQLLNVTQEPAISSGLSTQYWRGDKTWQLLNTTNVPEGSNLYFTTGRASSAAPVQSVAGRTGTVTLTAADVGLTNVLNVAQEPAVTAGLTTQYYRGDKSWQTLNTTNVAEGTNLYFTTGRASSAAPVQSVAGKTGAVTLTTTDITEGTNLYFTTGRAANAAPVQSVAGRSGHVTLAASDVGLSNVLNVAQEPALTAGLSTQYYRGDKTWQTLNTTNVAEGTNLYFTTGRASSAAPVQSVAGRTGTVVLAESDITNLTTDLAAKAGNASPTFTGVVTLPVTGATQCLHVDSLGRISGTGADCGSGTGGGEMVYPAAGIAQSTGTAWGTSLAIPAGSLVGTTATQTMTNKTLDTPTLTGTPVTTTPSTSDNSTRIASTAYVKAQAYITGNQSITVSGDASASGTTTLATTVTGLRGASVPALSAGLLRYTGAAFAWDSASYLTGNQTITLSGDLSGSGATSIAATIPAGTVTLGKMANLAANSIIGNNTGSAGVPLALTVAQTKALLAIGESDVTSLVSDLALKAPLASPALTGTPTAPTLAADTNTTGIATSAFVLGQAGAASPVMDGTATVGTSYRYSRQDHVHPTDTSRAATGQTFYLGSTQIAINRTTGSQSLTGITSIDGTAAAWTTARNLAGNSVNGSADVAFSNKFIVQGASDSGLSGAQFLGALGTGLVKNTTTTGVLSIAVAGTDYLTPSDVDDTPVDGVTTAPVSSNWAYDFAATVNAMLPTGSDGTYGLVMSNNTTRSPTASTDELYFEGNVAKFNQNGTEYSAAIGPTGTQISFSGTLTHGKVCTFGTGGVITCNTDIGAGSIGGSTGSTDNAIMRADGTGGSTLQSSGVTIADDGTITTTQGTGVDVIGLRAGSGTGSTNYAGFSGPTSAPTTSWTFGLPQNESASAGVLVAAAASSHVNALSVTSTPTITGTNITGVPISTGISGLGTGVATAAGNNVDSASGLATYSHNVQYSATPTIDDPDNWTMSGAGVYGGTWIANAAGTGALPAAVAGMNFTVAVEGTGVARINPNGSEVIYLNGTACSAGYDIYNSGTTGDSAVFQYRSSGTWLVTAKGFSCGS